MKKQGNSLTMHLLKTGRLLLTGFCVSMLAGQVGAQTPATAPVLRRCGSSEYEKMVLQLRDPARRRNVDQLNQLVEQVQLQQQGLRQAADQTVYRIPVVVHVIHNTSTGVIGGATNGNISDEQIASQLQVLNEDYRRKEGTPGFNTSPIGADTGIEFYLATTDPNGNATTGITRHYYSQKSSFDVFNDDELLSQIAYWPSNRYLNIWVTALANNYLGYGQFPTAADTLKGLISYQNELIDGVIIDYRYFGRRTGAVRSDTYCCGRTTTHEIGHWLGLIHTWGDGDGCAEDYVADTPPTKGPNQTSQCRTTYSTCVNGVQTRDLTENYMDYSPDGCMNLFTAGQAARMRAVLQLSPRRQQLIRALNALPETDRLTINVYPNPTLTADPTVDVQLKGFQSFTVGVYDMTGRQIRALSYTNSPSSRVSLNVLGLPAGVYVVRVRTDTEVASSRLLVR